MSVIDDNYSMTIALFSHLFEALYKKGIFTEVEIHEIQDKAKALHNEKLDELRRLVNEKQ